MEVTCEFIKDFLSANNHLVVDNILIYYRLTES